MSLFVCSSWIILSLCALKATDYGAVYRIYLPQLFSRERLHQLFRDKIHVVKQPCLYLVNGGESKRIGQVGIGLAGADGPVQAVDRDLERGLTRMNARHGLERLLIEFDGLGRMGQ